MDFNEFVQTRREALGKDDKVKLEIVLGNEACDLDSAVSALAYAFLLYTQRPTGTEIVPVLNVATFDYQLKTEVVFLFSKYGIVREDLIFIDELDSFRKGRSFSVHLVDHNVPAARQSDLAAHVVSVVDHHKQESTSADKEFFRIEVVGSCCSLITDLFYQRIESVKSNTLAHLLRATILADTVCFLEEAGKVKPLDVAMVTKLEEEHSIEPGTRQQLFQQIEQAKTDVSALTTEQILKKDAKMVIVPSHTAFISSVPLHVQAMLTRGDVVAAFESVLRQQSATLLAVTCSGRTGSGVVKHFLLYTKDFQLRIKLMEMIDSDPHLQFEEAQEFSGYEQFVVRKFGNTKISRKQVLPRLQAFLQQLSTSDEPFCKLRSDSDQLTFTLELSAPGTPAVVDSPVPEPCSSQENSGDHTPNPLFSVEAPPNSFKDPSLLDTIGPHLPSFNNSEMVKRIMIKKDKLGTDDPEDITNSENNSGHNSCPFTPANSFADRYMMEELHLPSFNNREMMHRILQKKLPLIGDSGDVSPADDAHGRQIFTPHNSECEGDLGTSPAFDQSDLEHRLTKFEASDSYKCERSRGLENTAHSLVDNVLEQAMNKLALPRNEEGN